MVTKISISKSIKQAKEIRVQMVGIVDLVKCNEEVALAFKMSFSN